MEIFGLVIVLAFWVICGFIGIKVGRWFRRNTTEAQRAAAARRTKRQMNGVLKMYGLKK